MVGVVKGLTQRQVKPDAVASIGWSRSRVKD
jgi:hypothetical protein